MDKRYEYTLHYVRDTNSKQAYEKMFYIIRYQENVN
jgi:hypothetical protein